MSPEFEMLATVEKSTLVFAKEHYSERLRREMLPLWNKHYDEIALYKDIPLSPNLSLYEFGDKHGLNRIFTARDNGKLVGYQVFFVSPHPHYSTALSATQDILYLSPEMRKGLNGLRFIRWCDSRLKEEGVNLVFQHVKKSHDFGLVLSRLGYVEHDVIWSKRLA